MEEEYKGVCLELDTNSQVEFNRRKNVSQDEQIKNLSKQVQDLLNRAPAGFLPRVYYGLQQGDQTFRFNLNQIIVAEIEGPEGQAYEFYESNELPNAREYIPAIGVKEADGTIKIIIQGDYNNNIKNFKIVNMTTGATTHVELTNLLSKQPASYLGAYNAADFKEKQITALYDITTNQNNVIYASIDINLDNVYNWVAIGQLATGADGVSVYSANDNTINSIVDLMKIKDSFIAGTAFKIDEIEVKAGDIYELTQILPTRVFEKRGSILGPQGIKGNPGTPGKNGADGATPQIVDSKWNIGGVDTGVIAVGQNGKDGQNGKSFQIVSGLWSVPANVGNPNNLAPDGSVLNTLPSLPRTGITGLAAVVYDPITTPLDPRYDLYFANDNDREWTIIEHYNGTDGKDGQDGKTPYIKDNNWYIGDNNTGVQAQGQTGSQGPQGKSIVPVDMAGDIELLKADDSFICMQDITLPTVPTTQAQKGDIYLIVTASPDLEVSYQGNLAPEGGGGGKKYKHDIDIRLQGQDSQSFVCSFTVIDDYDQRYTKETFLNKYRDVQFTASGAFTKRNAEMYIIYGFYINYYYNFKCAECIHRTDLSTPLEIYPLYQPSHSSSSISVATSTSGATFFDNINEI